MMRRIFYIIGGIILVLILLGTAGRFMGWFGGGADGIAVQAENADERTITQVVTAFGRAQPEVEVTISPDVAGEIVELNVREGAQVSQGDLLVRLRPDNYQAQLERTQAEVARARANLAEREADSLQVRLEYDRQKRLFERDVIPQSEYEAAESRYKQAVARLQGARYQVQSAMATLRDAREQLEKTNIYAPMSGTISKLDVELGERVVGTSQMQGTEMMRIARLNQMEMEVDINENDVVNVSPGDTARIEIDAHPDRTFRGTVTEIANSARVSGEGTQEQVTNFPVKIRLLDAHNEDAGEVMTGPEGGIATAEDGEPVTPAPVIRPGMSGSVDISTRTVENVISVPIQAVTVRNMDDEEGGGRRSADRMRRVVFVAEGDSAHVRAVDTGIADDTYIEVRSGLSAGERVVTGPYSAVSRELNDGSLITIEESPRQGGRRTASR
ncbi:MAG: efflux RND transporter periplasmic adaptor subunit [Longimonas sp.]|uniref:efflux RND transporter periplasmic adaptor subunit n=1 Tax=Longimonas sp. TaxID=2039626 RepID=UPI0033554413